MCVHIHGPDIGSNLHFQNPEKLSEGDELCVSPTLGSDISRYQVIVNYQVVFSGNNASLVSQESQRNSQLLTIRCPTFLSFV